MAPGAWRLESGIPDPATPSTERVLSLNDTGLLNLDGSGEKGSRRSRSTLSEQFLDGGEASRRDDLDCRDKARMMKGDTYSRNGVAVRALNI